MATITLIIVLFLPESSHFFAGLSGGLVVSEPAWYCLKAHKYGVVGKKVTDFKLSSGPVVLLLGIA